MAPLIALLVLAGSIAASAAIPGSDGVIHGCYRVSDGRLRVIDPNMEGACAAGERSLTWNAKGLRGPKGPKGVVGPRGPKGLRGLRGVVGPRGLKGVAGLRGLQGLQGLHGLKGDPGTTITHVVASFAPATDSFSVASWTQPANTIANVYWRVNVTTPGTPCQSAVAAHVGAFQFWLNDTTDAGAEAGNADMAPAQTESLPALGTDSTSALGALLPGQYDLKTEMNNSFLTVPALDCTGTVVQTDVWVEVEGT
jgi:Collagen triple helix repeat (20 copies).